MPSPEVLWSRWRAARREDAFEALVRPHLPYVVDLARRQGIGADEADDVVQETLLELARTKGDEPVRVGVRPWLARRVRFRTKKTMRSFARRRRHERAAPLPRADATDLDVRDEVEAALALLRPGERQAVVLRYLHDMDYREIGYVLDVSQSAARTRVHRGLDRLRRSLGGHAAALVAALGLPRVADASLIGNSIAAGTAVAGGGMLLMGTAVKLAGAAVVGAALAAASIWTFDDRARAPRAEGARGSVAADRAGDERGARAVLSELGVTDVELAWMRDALVRERTRRENAIIRPDDTGLDILERREKWGADVTSLVADHARFARHVRRSSAAPLRFEATGEETKVLLDESVLGTEALEFGPGTFVIDPRGWAFVRQDGGARHLEIRGAGMDRTTLVPDRIPLLQPHGNIANLVIRDLTVDGRAQGRELVFAFGAVSVRLENVRTRCASSPVLRVGDGAYLACDGCEFLGGYDVPEGSGSYFTFVQGTFLASFRDCLFADLSSTISAMKVVAAASEVSFEGCHWENAQLLEPSFAHDGKPHFPVTIRGGSVQAESEAWWGAPHAKEVRDVQFGPRVPRCRVGDLLRVARAFDPVLREGEMLRGVQLLAANRDAPRDFVAWIRVTGSDGSTLQRPRFVTLENGSPKIHPYDAHRRLPSLPGWDPRRGEGARALVELAAAARLDDEREAHRVALVTQNYRGEVIPMLQFGGYERYQPPFLRLHAVTGERLR